MEIKLTANHELFVITKLISFGKEIAIVMMPISEKQENALDNGSEIKLGNIWVAPEQIFCYGEMNFDNEDDIQLINNFEWIIFRDNTIIIWETPFYLTTNHGVICQLEVSVFIIETNFYFAALFWKDIL